METGPRSMLVKPHYGSTGNLVAVGVEYRIYRGL